MDSLPGGQLYLDLLKTSTDCISWKVCKKKKDNKYLLAKTTLPSCMYDAA